MKKPFGRFVLDFLPGMARLIEKITKRTDSGWLPESKGGEWQLIRANEKMARRCVKALADNAARLVSRIWYDKGWFNPRFFAIRHGKRRCS